MEKTAKDKITVEESVLTKRYGSIAEIKRDLFPVAAAQEAQMAAHRPGGYEKLMNEFFGSDRTPVD
jgi:hypothetical protein